MAKANTPAAGAKPAAAADEKPAAVEQKQPATTVSAENSVDAKPAPVDQKQSATQSSVAAGNSADDGKKPGPAQDAQSSTPVKGFFIRSRPATGFRRCGFAFTPEGFGIEESALTEEQIEILMKEPNLVVQFGEFGGNVEQA